MTLLTPLGLLGLIGIAILIIIYIIRPNFQQKFISSTYVWKLSLKYRKKRIPTSKLRNLLLILCQVLFLATCAAILARPNLILQSAIKEPEVIVILDASASMRAHLDGEKRFVRAVDEASLLVEETFDNDGYVSLILADDDPQYLLSQRMRKDALTQIDEKFETLITGDTQCTYASSNIDGAIGLCESVIRENPNAKIYLYTDTDYIYVPEEIEVVNVSEPEEWNGAILNAEARYEDNFYTIYVDVACYGDVDQKVNVEIELYNVNALDNNDKGSTVKFTKTVQCIGGQTTKLIFINKEFYDENEELYLSAYGENVYVIDPTKNAKDLKVFSYKSMHVSLQDEMGNSLSDALWEDNTFDVYGGMKQVLKVQYASAEPNTFWPAALRQIQKVYADRWDIQLKEVKKGETPAIDGYDLYIFEHEMPTRLPEDGVLVLSDPDINLPLSTGIRIQTMGSTANPLGAPLTEAMKHPLLNRIDADEITVSKFTGYTLDGSYESLLTYDRFPMLAVRNEESIKIVLMSFSLHYSNLPILLEFPMLVKNVFDYFFPATVNGNAFEVNEKVEVNSMGQKVSITGYNYEETFDSFPASFVVSTPGTYTIKQTTFFGKEIVENVYVQVAKEESNIFQEKEKLSEPYQVENKGDILKDILLYLAIAIVTLAFIEWWLRNMEGM
jgi:hypothetical protein